MSLLVHCILVVLLLLTTCSTVLGFTPVFTFSSTSTRTFTWPQCSTTATIEGGRYTRSYSDKIRVGYRYRHRSTLKYHHLKSLSSSTCSSMDGNTKSKEEDYHIENSENRDCRNNDDNANHNDNNDNNANNNNHVFTLLQKIDNMLISKIPNYTSLQNDILKKIDDSHRLDMDFCSSFASEGVSQSANKRPPKYQYINIQQNKDCNNDDDDDDDDDDHDDQRKQQQEPFLSIQTTDDDYPILDESSISTIINAAESTWFSNTNNDNNNNAESRFTIQRKGNYEAHTVDLANSVNGDIHTIMNDALLNRIYPLIRDAFVSRAESEPASISASASTSVSQNMIPDLNEIEFCVYDSLVIRYNSTEALMMTPTSSTTDDINIDDNIDNNSDNNSDDNSDDNSDGGINDNVQGFIGAGQPLHRDLGVVSVNIMLNSDKDFEGGGTFFEEQMRPHATLPYSYDMNDIDEENNQEKSSLSPLKPLEPLKPLKPSGVGQALLHLSSNRHAGAGTTCGVRDILVIFLTAKNLFNQSNTKNNNRNNDNTSAGVPMMEKAARLKAKAREYSKELSSSFISNNTNINNNNNNNVMKEEEVSILYRMVSHRLAIKYIPTDGEAWHYLGIAIREYVLLAHSNTDVDATSNNSIDRISAINLMYLCTSCLKHALTLTPCDGRLCNNLGLAHETLFELTSNTNINTDIGTDTDIEINDENINIISNSENEQKQITNYYRQSQLLHNLAEEVGCDVLLDSDMACLNYGLYLSKQDRFKEAADILSRFGNVNFDFDNSNGNVNGASFMTNSTRNRNNNQEHMRIEYDGNRLYHFCKANS